MLTIICFSKNRPFQLSEYLRTAVHYLDPKPQIYVVYQADPEYSAAYNSIINNNEAHFIPQGVGEDLAGIVHKILTTVTTPLVAFGVDDLLFYRRVPIGEIKTYLDAYGETLLGASMRLNPRITFCQPANAPQVPPRLAALSEALAAFQLGEGTLDWDYPYELCATVYRRDHLISLFQGMLQSKRSYPTPNFIEEWLHLYYLHRRGLGAANPQLLCLRRPVCSVITVNRVQGEFPNGVYPGPTDSELTQYFKDGRRFDDHWYASQNFNRIHIGDFVLADCVGPEK